MPNKTDGLASKMADLKLEAKNTARLWNALDAFPSFKRSDSTVSVHTEKGLLF